MKKTMLKQMPPLLATRKMFDVAAGDEPKIEKQTYYWGRTEVREVFKYGRYFRACVENGILKVAVFFVKELRLRCALPAYEIFLSKEEDDFITFDREKGTWRTAAINRLDEYDSSRFYVRGEWIGAADAKTIRNYLGTNEPVYDAVLSFQNGVRKRQLDQRHRKITDPWDEDLSQIHELPKDWDHWVDKVGIRQNYIFYHYARNGAKQGYCTYCGKEVPLKRHPYHNNRGICPCCRHHIFYKSYGKAGRFATGENYLYLLQRCRDGFAVRLFSAARYYSKDNYETPEIFCQEIRRTIFDERLNPRSYYWGLYSQRELRWIKGGVYDPFHCYSRTEYRGSVYGKTIPSLAAKELKNTGLAQWISLHPRETDPEEYMAVLRKYPFWEKLWKGSLPKLTEEVWKSGFYSFDSTDPHASSLKKVLGLDSSRLNRLRKVNGGHNVLEWLQYEKSVGHPISDETLGWFSDEEITASEVSFILDRMSPQQISNYLTRQAEKEHTTPRSVLGTWKDYLSMAVRLHYDVSDEIVYRCKELRRRHDELVDETNLKRDELQAEEILNSHPGLELIFKGPLQKYEYADEKYRIIAPSSVLDIIREGKALHHCVASSQHYWDRMERRESYILFLRKAEASSVPFYTLEVEPNGTIRQKRTEFDRQGKDLEAAAGFLREWQSVISERMTSDDEQLAQTSKVLRLQEFEALKKDRVVVHTRDLQGQLLVDVLMADLMEAPENGKKQASEPAAA